jgi:ABC-type antimicrobial peptide transport system permease subunit
VKQKLPDLLFFLIKDIRYDWARTALTVVGMAMVIFSFFILNAFSRSIDFFTESVPMGSNLIVIQSDLIIPSDSSIEKKALMAAEQIPADLIMRISPVLFRQLRINDQVVQLRGARVEDWTNVFNMELIDGQWPKDFGEVAVGEGAAESNGWRVGSTVKIYGSMFRISAIARLPSSAFASIWMPLEQAEILYDKKDDYQMLVVQTAKDADAEMVKQQLQTNLQLVGEYSVFFEDSYNRQNNQMMKDMSSLMNISASMALLAVTFGTYTSTNLSLSERGREIGILRAIGFSHEVLRRLLGLRAVIQGILAFCLGLAAAGLFMGYQCTYSHLYVLWFNLILDITWQTIIGCLLLVTGLALFGAWISSHRLLFLDVNHMLRD